MKKSDMEYAEAAKRLVNMCYRHMLEAYPDGGSTKCIQYKCFYRHVIKLGEEFQTWRRRGRCRPGDWQRYKSVRDEMLSNLCIRLAVGPLRALDSPGVREAGEAFAGTDTAARRAEMRVLNEVAWYLAVNAGAPRLEEGEPLNLPETPVTLPDSLIDRAREALATLQPPSPHV